MKLTVKQSDLNRHLASISKAIPSRPSHPILANVRMVADSTEAITLTGFDLSLGLQTKFLATEVEEPGEICLPAGLLSDIVSRLPDGEIELSIDDLQCTIKSDSGKYQLQGQPVEEYPELPSILSNSAESIALLAATLSSGLNGTLFAASTDETRQVLTGVHIKSSKEGIEFASIDGRRLALAESPAGEENSIVEFALTIPAKVLIELNRMIQGAESVSLQYDAGMLLCECGDKTLTTRLLEGQYPNYRQLIPNQFARELTVNRRALISSLERVMIIADRKNNIVKVEIDATEQQLILSAETADMGSAREALEISATGDNLTLAFNGKYLLEGLKSFSSSQVLICTNNPASPVVLHPVGGDKVTYLVMPVAVRS